MPGSNNLSRYGKSAKPSFVVVERTPRGFGFLVEMIALYAKGVTQRFPAKQVLLKRIAFRAKDVGFGPCTD